MFIDSAEYNQDLLNVASSDLPWEQLRGKSVLITGATGLIGVFLVDALMMKNRREDLQIKIYAVSRDHAVAAQKFGAYLEDEDFSLMCFDVNKKTDLAISVDYIIHAASNTHPRAYAGDPIGSILTNIIGTNNLLAYAAEHRIERFIFLSSVEIYGEPIKQNDIFDEKYCGYIDCNSLRAGYSEGKRAGEALCNAYSKKYEMDIVIPRLSRTYGPTMKLDDSKAMSQFILNGVKAEDIVLKSEGKQEFSYCYMADAVMGILFVWLKGKSGEAYNIAEPGNTLSLREITECIAGINGRKVIFQLPDKQEKEGFSKVQRGVMNVEKLLALGWKPVDNMESGLRKTIAIMKSVVKQE